MKFHRVLLFTTIQMDVTPVGEDLHVLLTNDNIPYICCTAYASPTEDFDDLSDLDFMDFDEDIEADESAGESDEKASGKSPDLKSPDPIITIITSDEDPEKYFTIYVADQLARHTGKNVLCTGGVYVENPDQHQIDKLYENINEMIMDWVNFLND